MDLGISDRVAPLLAEVKAFIEEKYEGSVLTSW